MADESPGSALGRWIRKLFGGGGSDPEERSPPPGKDHGEHDAGTDRQTTGERDAASDDPAPEPPSIAVEAYERDGWHWRILDDGGEVLAVSPRPLESETAVREHVDAVSKDIGSVRLTVRADPPETEMAADHHARDGESPTPGVRPAEPESGTFELYETGGGWRWRLRDEREAILTEAGVGTDSVDAAEDAIAEFADAAPGAGTLEYAPAGFEVYRDAGESENADEARGDWRWRLRHRDGDLLARSPGRYGNRDDAIAAVETLKGTDEDPILVEGDEGWTWRVAVDGTAVAVAPGAHEDETRARAAYERASDCVADAGVIELDPVGFELAAGDDGWRFRARHRDGHVVAATEGYDDREAAVADLRRVMSIAPGADVGVRERETERIIEEALADAERARSLVERVSEDTDRTAESIRELLERATSEAAGGGSVESGDPGNDRGDAFEADGDAGEGEEDADDGSAREDGDDERDDDGSTREDGDVEDADEGADDPDPTAEVDAGTEAETDPDAADPPVFEVHEADGGWSVRLRRGDAEVGTATVTFPGRGSAIDAVERIAGAAADATPVGVDPATFQVAPDGEEWRWRLVAADGTVLAVSGDPCEDRAEARESIADAREALSGGTELYEEDGWRWRLRHERRIVAAAPRGYDDTDAARAAVDRARELAPDADVVIVEGPVGEVHPANGGWGWRVRDADGSVLLAGTGHESVASAEDALSTVREVAPGAPMRIARGAESDAE